MFPQPFKFLLQSKLYWIIIYRAPSVYSLNSVMRISAEDCSCNTHHQRVLSVGYAREHLPQDLQANVTLFREGQDATVWKH